jgi:hypothetical protein
LNAACWNPRPVRPATIFDFGHQLRLHVNYTLLGNAALETESIAIPGADCADAIPLELECPLTGILRQYLGRDRNIGAMLRGIGCRGVRVVASDRFDLANETVVVKRLMENRKNTNMF